MKSFDTNVALYGINADCPEHEPCRRILERARTEEGGWIVADQVWLELYRLLRNPAVLSRPLDARRAADAVAWYRSRTGLHCAWDPELMPRLHERWRDADFPARRSFDLVLALTLAANGVTEFYTRNSADFDSLGLFAVMDPLTAR